MRLHELFQEVSLHLHLLCEASPQHLLGIWSAPIKANMDGSIGFAAGRARTTAVALSHCQSHDSQATLLKRDSWEVAVG